MEFEMLESDTAGKTNIRVIGVGGAGGNAVQHMIRRGVQGVEFICMNTDAGALKRSKAEINLQLAWEQVRVRRLGPALQLRPKPELPMLYKAHTWFLLLRVWVVEQEPELHRLLRRWQKKWVF